MRLLFFYQHFWPDSPPYANMLRVIGSELADSGHTVSMITSEPSYKVVDRSIACQRSEELDGIHVKRLRLLPGARGVNSIRLLGKAIFPLRALFSVVVDSLKGYRQDIIVAATIPPVANGLMAYIAAKLTGAKFVYHLQDIYPEIGAVGGLWSTTGHKHRLLKWLDTLICKKADQCIVLSNDMAESLASRGVDLSKVSVINNFMLSEFEDDLASDNRDQLNISATTAFRLVFAGNLGRFQGLEEFLQAFLDLPESQNNIELHFVGEGVMASKLKAMAAHATNVLFHGHKPFKDACRLMAQCDAGIVSIQPDVYRYAYPSKTLTYLGLGLPVFALVEEDSSMANEIESLQLGVSVPNDGKDVIQSGFQKLIEFLKSEANDKTRIASVVAESMSKDAAIRHWVDLLDSIELAKKNLISTGG